MKYNKIELENYIFVEKLSYREIGKIYNVTDAAIKKAARRLGITLPVRSKFPDQFKPHNKKTRYCLHCTQEIKTKNNFFCSKKHFFEYKSKQNYFDFLAKTQYIYNPNYSPYAFKKHFLVEQNFKCANCGEPNIWNNKELVFILDHIDGDAGNNKRENLRLVCPNCDSQLETYKSKNKKSARNYKRYGGYKNHGNKFTVNRNN